MIQENILTAVGNSKRILACVLAFLIPGAGHIVLGRYARGLLFSFCIYAMVITGLMMKGHLYIPTDADRLSFLFFLGDVGMGLLYPVLYVLGIGLKFYYVLPTFEYGNNFIASAGLLNYLIVLDSFDIASGRKH